MKTYTARYWRHGVLLSKRFKSKKEAAQFLLDGEYNGTLSWTSVTDSDGECLVDGDTSAGFGELRKLGAK